MLPATQTRTLQLGMIVCLCWATSPSFSAEPKQTAVFVSGQDGYHTYRIPALLTTPHGTLLAFAEGRQNSPRDTGDIDVVLKRSTDHGKTWSAMQIVWDDGANTCGNPCPVVDRTTGVIHLLLTHNLGSDSESDIVRGKAKGARTVWHCTSSDDGRTWSKPVEITAPTKKPEWTWYATGPGIGIQTGTGRLVIPCDFKADGGKTLGSHIIYSDDAGKTWKLGGTVQPDCNECQVVELSDGTLMLNIRSYRKNFQRLVALSRDGGLTWSEPKSDETLIEPVCQASIIRLGTSEPKKATLLFSNPASKKRERMTLRFSDDDGATWKFARELWSGPAAYSCLSVLHNGEIGCLYERGEKSPYETITFATFPLSWLTQPLR